MGDTQKFMTVFELITALETLPPGLQVMLDMTTDNMEQFKFVALDYVGEVGIDDERGETVGIALLSQTDFEGETGPADAFGLN